MILTSTQIAQLVSHARADAPNETCGIIGGKDARALKIIPLPNNDATPQVRYNAEPSALLAAMREIDAKDWEHLAIYHSHPAAPAYPSPVDIARAFYPDTIYLIVSLMNPEQALVRGFRIVQGTVTEITIEVEDDEPSPTNSRRTPARPSRPHSRRAVAALSQRRPQRADPRRARRRVSKKI